jgi:hypothetical protein
MVSIGDPRRPWSRGYAGPEHRLPPPTGEKLIEEATKLAWKESTGLDDILNALTMEKRDKEIYALGPTLRLVRLGEANSSNVNSPAAKHLDAGHGKSVSSRGF